MGTPQGNTPPPAMPAVAPAQTQAADDDQFDDIRRELKTRYELLPEDIQKVIMDEGYQTKLIEIAKAQKLTYEELGLLETETTMVLLGMRKPEDYRDQVQYQLKKNDPAIDSLVNAVNEQVFAPIRSSLEKVYAERNEAEQSLEAETPVATPTTTVQASSVQTSVKITPPQTIAAPTQVKITPPVAEPTKLSSNEESVLKTSGVILSETPAPIKIVPPSATPTRTDVLKGIENPPRMPTGIMADKLATTGPIMPTKTTDYSLQKRTAPVDTVTPPKSSNDPYREPIG